jgi:hypothetical protein
VRAMFSYLTSLLEGEAKAVVAGLSATADNYDMVIKILKDRFGYKDRIIFSRIRARLNITLPSTHKTSIRNLWALQDTIQTHVRNQRK